MVPLQCALGQWQLYNRLYIESVLRWFRRLHVAGAVCGGSRFGVWAPVPRRVVGRRCGPVWVKCLTLHAALPNCPIAYI